MGNGYIYMSDPQVTVILPVYNAELYLKECLESLKQQTLRDFEVLIFDDASTDRSYGILMAFDDPRFHVERSRENQGYAVYLNRGILHARGKYIARMDADDLCHPERLEKQVQFLEKNSEIGICGTGFEVFGNVERKVFRKPLTDFEIRWTLLLDNPFQHPTVMMRRSVLEENDLRYREDLMPTEDYELWSRLLQHTKGANLPDALLLYRFHEKQETSARRVRQLELHKKIASENVARFFEIQKDLAQGSSSDAKFNGDQAGRNLDISWAMRFRMGSLKKGECCIRQIVGYYDFLRIYFLKSEITADTLKRDELKRLGKWIVQEEKSWVIGLGLILLRPSIFDEIFKRLILELRKTYLRKS